MSESTTWLPWILKFAIVLVTAWLSRRPKPASQEEDYRVQIVVLGDIGRSPRMQYHALSIAKHGGEVDLFGYQESELHPGMSAANNINIFQLSPFPTVFKTNNRCLFLVFGPLKVISQIWTLWCLLQIKGRRAGWMLVQNPPSIPTLAIALFICRLRDTKLVIDWHNFGYSLLALKFGLRHPLVRASRTYEQFLGCLAHAHLCVTDAMARILKEEHHVISPVLTLHDRPTPTFQILDEAQRSAFLNELPQLALADMDTRIATEMVHSVKMGNTKLLVSSTSWTPDEDFSLLLDALVGYAVDLHRGIELHLPKLLVIVTGKGPQKAAFEGRVATLAAQGRLPHVIIKTAYFDSVNDYAKLLGCADLGISLHTSSSGVDLPMKVVDMFGAGLPVVGWGNFEAWPELVKEDVNGIGFSDAESLEKILKELFARDPKLLAKLKKGALEEGKRRWDDEWDPVAGTLFGLCSRPKGRDKRRRR